MTDGVENRNKNTGPHFDRWRAPIKPLVPIAVQLNKQRQAAEDQLIRKMFGALLKHLCRELEDICPRGSSLAADKKARELGIKENLTEVHWDQRKTLVRADHQFFHWEHFVPVQEMLKELDKARTEEQVAAVLRTARIVWVLKSEDERLTELGFRSARPDPHLAYSQAGIDLATVKQ